MAVSHLNKSGGTKAITKVMGSVQWVATPRRFSGDRGSRHGSAVVFAGQEQLSSGPYRLRLPYRRQRLSRTDQQDQNLGIRAGPEPITISAEEALAAASRGKQKAAGTYRCRRFSARPSGCGAYPGERRSSRSQRCMHKRGVSPPGCRDPRCQVTPDWRDRWPRFLGVGAAGSNPPPMTAKPPP